VTGTEDEAEFLAAAVAGITDVSYADVENAPSAVIVGLEPEEECPILFLRLRKGHVKKAAGHGRGAVPEPGFREARRALVAAVRATRPGCWPATRRSRRRWPSPAAC
jgi:NADH-quinone oxidoreductase subunit G